MITLPLFQVSLILMLSLCVIRDALRRRLVSACMLATLLLYSGYLLAIDITGQIAQVRVFADLPAEFVAANCTIVASFTLWFLIGGWAVSRIIPAPTKPADTGKSVLGPLFLGVALVALSADGWWLMTPYPQNKGAFQLIQLGGAGAVANLLILIALTNAHYAKRQLGIVRCCFWLVALHYGLAGDRGSSVFLLIGAYGIHLASLPRLRWHHAVQTICLGAALLIALEQISYLRSWGQQAPSQGGSFLEEIDLLPQSVAHMFHAISIHQAGYQTFEGGAMDFLATLWIQVIPSGLLNALGVDLYNGPIMLSDFVIHGGGFFVPAELYFAGGMLPLGLTATYFGALAALADRIASRRGDTLMITVVLLVAASSAYTMFYGVQAVNRMLTLPIVLLLLRSVVQRSLQRLNGRGAW